MAKKEFIGKIFDGRTNEDYKSKFKQYVNNLSVPKTPFNCSNLRVLPESVKLINTYGPSNNFEKKTLICDYNVQRDLSPECKINSKLQLDGDNNLIFKCLRKGKTRRFNAVLIDFEESK